MVRCEVDLEYILRALSVRCKYTLGGLLGLHSAPFTHSFTSVVAKLPIIMFYKRKANPSRYRENHD